MFYDDPRATGGPGMAIGTRVARVDETGTARVRVACAEETAAFCRGTLTVGDASRRLGSGRFSLRAGSSANVPVKLTRPALKALIRGGALRSRVTAIGSDQLQHTSSVTTSIVLRRAAR
jgi:hypothetical protein